MELGETPNRHLGVEVIGVYVYFCLIVCVILFLNIRITDQNFMLAGVLVLVGIELIFFIAACMGLHFGFVTKTVLMIA